MKHFKFTSTSIAFVAGIVLTITASAGVLKNTILAPEDFCYTNISSKITCTSATVSLSSLTCSQAQAYLQKPVYGLSIVGRIPLPEVSIFCPGGNAFCCAEIVSIPTALCASQPQFNIDLTGNKFYKITAVHCQP